MTVTCECHTKALEAEVSALLSSSPRERERVVRPPPPATAACRHRGMPKKNDERPEHVSCVVRAAVSGHARTRGRDVRRVAARHASPSAPRRARRIRRGGEGAGGGKGGEPAAAIDAARWLFDHAAVDGDGNRRGWRGGERRGGEKERERGSMRDIYRERVRVREREREREGRKWERLVYSALKHNV